MCDERCEWASSSRQPTSTCRQKLPQNSRLRSIHTYLTAATAAPTTGAQLGYAHVSTGHLSLDQQLDAPTAAGVDPDRIYRDQLSGTSTRGHPLTTQTHLRVADITALPDLPLPCWPNPDGTYPRWSWPPDS